MKDADREVEMEEGAGKWMNLSCEAHAHPLPTISWTVTGSQVKQGLAEHWAVNVHYMTKSMWTPAHRTSHFKIMGINMELVPLCCYNSLHSFRKAFH
jgi:hypothetical protein